MTKIIIFAILSISLLLFGTVTNLSAQTTIPGGYVSGTWTADGSPYLIQGDITIHADSLLTIEPAVEVEFQGNNHLTVNGYLEAVGTEVDSIHFMRSSGSWYGITFQNAPDSSHLIYCSISDAGWAGILCQNSNPVLSHCSMQSQSAMYGIRVLDPSNPSISHCDVSYNYTGIVWSSLASGIISDCVISHSWGLGGIRLISDVELTIIDCIISDNVSDAGGGGVRSERGTLTLINCTINDNTAQGGRGGGISCSNGSATLTNCTINGNVAYDTNTGHGGGGISIYNASATLSYCSIYDNFAMDHGGGIAITNGNLTVDHCTIDENETWGAGSGSGISILSNNTAVITNSIISNNHNGYGILNQGTLTVDYTDFFNNVSGNITGNIPANFGILSMVNANGDSCDVYYNIFLDPIYVDPDNGDYHLLSGSPCIDAGDPDSPFDPDSTIADMGAFYFDQQTGIDDTRSIPNGFVLSQNYPNPFNATTTIQYSLSEPSDVIVEVYDILGRKVETINEDNQTAGMHQLIWNASVQPSGIYFYRIQAGNYGEIRKMVLLK